MKRSLTLSERAVEQTLEIMSPADDAGDFAGDTWAGFRRKDLDKFERIRARREGRLPPPRNPIRGSKAHRFRERKRMDGCVQDRDAYEAERRADAKAGRLF